MLQLNFLSNNSPAQLDNHCSWSLKLVCKISHEISYHFYFKLQFLNLTFNFGSLLIDFNGLSTRRILRILTVVRADGEASSSFLKLKLFYSRVIAARQS